MSAFSRGAPLAVWMERVDKAFAGVPVLKRVSLQVPAGAAFGIVGENGAGKSTLVNILGGNLQPDGGTMHVHGAPYAPASPNDARRAGIAFVHQELNLFPNLSIAENLYIDALPRRSGLPWIDRGRLRAGAAEALARVGLARGPDTRVERLAAGERQLVEIARAMAADARVLILDEPTTSLSVPERDRLFTLVRELRRQGITIIYISHDLGDVLRLCQRAAVLRDGEVVAEGDIGDFSVDRLLTLMVGRPVSRLYPHSPASARPAPRPPLLTVRGLTQPGVVRDIGLVLHSGELLGLFGLMGAGRSELARILFGLDRYASGEILIDGRPLAGSPRDRIRQRMAFLTEDRHDEGLCLDASVADNITLVTLPELAGAGGLVRRAKIDAAVDRIRGAVRLTGRAAPEQPVRTLSGGNQQKVVLAKWLLAGPRVLILDEPTRGIDVAAKAEIYELIRRLADGGAGVLLISSEIDELTGLCDRILVMRRGELSGEFVRGAFDREAILASALPVGGPA